MLPERFVARVGDHVHVARPEFPQLWVGSRGAQPQDLRPSGARLIWNIYGIDPHNARSAWERWTASLSSSETTSWSRSSIASARPLTFPSSSRPAVPSRGLQGSRPPGARSLCICPRTASLQILTTASMTAWTSHPTPENAQTNHWSIAKSQPPKDLLEIVDSFPGKTLCWASELEDLRKKEVTE